MSEERWLVVRRKLTLRFSVVKTANLCNLFKHLKVVVHVKRLLICSCQVALVQLELLLHVGLLYHAVFTLAELSQAGGFHCELEPVGRVCRCLLVSGENLGKSYF